MPRLLLTAALVISGGAALIYETIWTRQLGLLMGHTVAAATCVLAAFMLGLAVGAAAGGRIAVRSSPASALRAAAVLEVVIGGLALLLPAEIAGLHPLLGWAYGDAGGPAFAVTRFVTALIVVLLPALAMGATLPLVVRRAVSSSGQAGREIAWLYAANSAGAAIGAVLSGFVLLPALGMYRATLVAAALNGIAAALLEATARLKSSRDRSIPAGPGALPTLAGSSRTRSAITLALGLSGAASLILQLAWTRILSLLLGPTTYAFSTMVATFIAGIALGSLTAGSIGRGRPSPVLLVTGLVVAGIAAVAAAAWTPHFTLMVADAASNAGGFGSVMWEQALLVGFMMLPMTIGFGAAFPLAVGLAATDDRGIPREVAGIYTANALGALIGAVGGGYLLIPAFGLQVTVFIAAGLCIAAGVVVWIAHAPHDRSRLTGVALLTGLGVAAWFVPPWDRALVSSGAYKYAAYLPSENRDALLRAGEVLYYREGAASTVSVRRIAGATTLAIDGKVDASNAGDMLTQRLLAHVPLLLHPDPREVAIIGLGSGVTLGSALRHQVSRVDTIEVSPQVIEASRHFTVENGNALDDPRGRVILGDGRTHLTFGRQRYDVIVSEPSNPWIAGVAGLFTREMFEIVRARLAPGGIACQWAHVYDMSDADLRSIVGTFTGVFPQAQLWVIGDTDILLVGANDPLESRLAALPRNWNRPGVAADLAGVSVPAPEVLLSLLAATSADLKVFTAGAASQSDDRLALEFSGPRSVFGQAGVTGLGALRVSAVSAPRRSEADGAFHRDRGLMLLGAESFASAAADLMISVTANPEDPRAIDGLLRSAAPASRLDEAERLLRAAAGGSVPRAAPAIGLSRILASRGDFGEAAAVLRPAIDAAGTPALLEQLASVFADAGDSRLSRVVSGLQKMAPDSDAARYFSAVLALAEGRPYDAIDVVSRQSNRNRAGFREFTLLGTAHAALGRHVEARQAFRDAVRADPRNAAGYENLGTAESSAGDFQAAAAHFAEALILDRASTVARKGLADARGPHR